MEKPDIAMTVTKEDIGYSASASLKDIFIGTQGEDFEELKTNIVDVVNLAFQNKGITYNIEEITLHAAQ